MEVIGTAKGATQPCLGRVGHIKCLPIPYAISLQRHSRQHGFQIILNRTTNKFIGTLVFFAALLLAVTAAPTPTDVEQLDIAGPEKGDLQVAASHWGGHWGGYGGHWGGWGGYYPYYGGYWSYPLYGHGYGYGWPYGYYGHHGYWWK
ncbi:hypothetical protein RR48_09960 [Papilio machaon]|uniref:Uncharacterized protein n=1 Tax=Papilio machaon TaxID=76193 RepID=A0A194REM6_PAPMA|nr:hypothetical protein RR48_09960 [Papilio machaon]